MPDLPRGTVTFLFTDIEGSTALWERDRAAMRAAVDRQLTILHSLISAHHGILFKTVGDGTQAAFASADEALRAAVASQRALLTEDWGEIGPLTVRMALHAGEAIPDPHGDYLAAPLNRLARLLATGYGGQILLSQTVQQLSRGALPAGSDLRDLGEHRLRDLLEPERVYQLVHPDLPAEFPPLKSLENRPNNLPLQPTPFLGREREVGAIVALLGRADVRLLTLTGPGGTGKTRLGLQMAAEVVDEFPDGVFFVPLAPLTDPALVPSAMAEGLGVREEGGQPLRERLQEYLAAKKLLLVLDNVEHLIEAAPVVGEVLAACPGLKVLATSRIPLRLQAEQEYPVPPLGLPRRKPPPLPEQLSQYEAVRLFIARAQAVKPTFVIDNQSAPAVAEICHRLDGLPLAIELAAARIRMLFPQAMLARLEQRLPMLTGGARDLPARHQTLRNTIAWSYDLLEPEEQQLFRRLAVFAGGASFEAVEAVVNPDGRLDVFTGLERLVEHSLLRQEEGLEDEPRFTMLETIREYGLDQLEASGEAEEIRQGHAIFFLTLAEDAHEILLEFDAGPSFATSMTRLEAEHDNLRAALTFALERSNTELALNLSGALGPFWETHGHLIEGLRWLERALATGAGSSVARARALLWAGNFVARQSDFARSDTMLYEALRIYKDVGDRHGVGRALSNLGTNAAEQGDFARAVELYEESLTFAQEIGHIFGIVSTMCNLAATYSELGEFTRAEGLLEEALALAEEHHSGAGAALGLVSLAELTLNRGEHEQAAMWAQQSLARWWTLRDRWGIVTSFHALALAMAVHRPEQAVRLFAAEEALRDASGIHLPPVYHSAYERALADLRATLDESAFAAAWEEGRTLPLESAVSEALEIALDVSTTPTTTA
jgi:predicted ATPase/class 3 adenylate cyclase